MSHWAYISPVFRPILCVPIKNPHQSAGFKYCAHQDLNLEPTDYESVALTD